MQIFAALVALASSALLATASPTPTEQNLVARACQTAWPAFARVEQANPNSKYLPGFTIAQDAGPSNKQDVFIQFNIPSGAYGCQLQAYFPAGFSITSSGSSQVNTYSLASTIPVTPSGLDVSWNSAPASVSLVGTTTFSSSPVNPTTPVINSFTCASVMAFRLSIASTSNAGSVSWAQGAPNGLQMVYNC